MRSETAQMKAATVMAPTTRRPHGSASSLLMHITGAARQAPALVLAQTASKPATCTAAPPTHAAKGTGGGMASRSTGVEPVFVVMLEREHLWFSPARRRQRHSDRTKVLAANINALKLRRNKWLDTSQLQGVFESGSPVLVCRKLA